VIEAQNMIGVRMRVENRVDAIDGSPKRLLAEIGSSVDEDGAVGVTDQDGGTQSLIARIGGCADLARAADGGYAGTGAGSQDCDVNGTHSAAGACSAGGAGLGVFSLTCMKRKRSSVREFSIRRCSSRLRFPRVFSESMASMSIACRAPAKSGPASPSP